MSDHIPDQLKCASVAQVESLDDRVKWLEDTAFKGDYNRKLGEEWIAWGNKHGFFNTYRADEWFANNREVRQGLEKRALKFEQKNWQLEIELAGLRKHKGEVLQLESDLRSTKDRADSYERGYKRAQAKSNRQAAEIRRLLEDVEELKKNPLGLCEQVTLDNYRQVAEALNLTGPGAIRDYVRGLEDEVTQLNTDVDRLQRDLMDCAGGEW